MVPTHLSRTPTGALCAGLDSPLPDPLNVGTGTAIVVTGWCYHQWLAIRQLKIQCGNSIVPVALSGIPRLGRGEDELSSPSSAGFAAVLPISGVTEPTTEPIVIHAALAGGRTESATIGSLRLIPSLERAELFSDSSVLSAERMGVRRRPYEGGEDETVPPAIAVCLTTSDPSSEIFARQIAALRGQTESNWICLVHDDGSRPESFAAIRGMLGDDRRFRLVRQSTKQGASRTLENCLSRAPSPVEFVALCGAREVWQRDALAVLRSCFTPRTSLICASAFPKSLSELLICEQPLGTAMIRRSVLDLILPFPPAPPDVRFDPWIACVAAMVGRIARIAEPICETIPASAANDADPLPTLSLKECLGRWLDGGRDQFSERWLRTQQLVQALRMRSGERISWAQHQALDRVADPLWLLVQAGRRWLGRPQTIGTASALLHSQLWSAVVRAQRLIGISRQHSRQPAAARRRAA